MGKELVKAYFIRVEQLSKIIKAAVGPKHNRLLPKKTEKPYHSNKGLMHK
jgi:hypothetical protein